MQKNNKQYLSILQWITERGIVSEKGEPFEYYNRPFLLDILCDFTPNIALMACAQVGKSVTFSIKTLFAVKHLHLNVIYTMPTDAFVNEFVASKFNKIVQMNYHEFKGMETDNVQRKELNDRFIFFDGTESKTAGISTTADVLIHDEISRSNQEKIGQYKSRTKASQYKGRWLFSNPGTERDELDLEHSKSDQKEWNITCPHCSDRHPLSWPDSVDVEKKCYVCRACKKPIDDDVRRKGVWIDRDGQVWNGVLNPRYKISGWRISHLMCPDIPLEEIIDESKGDPAYFNNFVLGKAYSPGDLSVTKTTILDLWTPKDLRTPNIYMGIDVGNIKHYIVRSDKGLLACGRVTSSAEIETLIDFWKPTSGVIDAMPDNFLAKYIVDKYPMFRMSYFMENNNNPQTIVWWGENDKKTIVYSHRDRILDQFLMGMVEAKWLIALPTDANFREYIKHFETLRRAKVVNNAGLERYVWQSTTGEDHYCFDGETPILTKTGYRSIKEIKIGEYVLTRKGYKKVLLSGLTKEKAAVVEAIFTDGTKLICTPEHPFWVEGKGMTALRDCNCHDILLSCGNSKESKSSSTESRTGVIQNQNDEVTGSITRQVPDAFPDVFTKQSGLIRMERFQKDLLSTMSTITLSTTKYPILNVSHQDSINRIISRRGGKKQTTEINKSLVSADKLQSERPLSKSGLKQVQGRNYSNKTLNSSELGYRFPALSVGKKVSQRASMVENSVHRDAPHDGMHENGVKNIQPIGLVTVNHLSDKRPVYNLHIEDEHEYFANGVLVSNCFADLYSYIAMLGAGSGVFYGEMTAAEMPSVLGADNVYDITRAFMNNNEGYAQES